MIGLSRSTALERRARSQLLLVALVGRRRGGDEGDRVEDLRFGVGRLARDEVGHRRS
jgi:hypothetical protein